MIKDIKKYYFFTLLASLTSPRLSNIQASLILPSTIAMFDSERHLSSFHSVTMHRIASSFKEETCSPIIKNRLKLNF